MQYIACHILYLQSISYAFDMQYIAHRKGIFLRKRKSDIKRKRSMYCVLYKKRKKEKLKKKKRKSEGIRLILLVLGRDRE